MNINDNAERYLGKMLPDYKSQLAKTDPEFAELFANFAFDEVVNQDDLDGKTRFIAIIAALLGCQGTDVFRLILPAALNFGVTPVEIKETVYQSVAYLGIGRVLPFLNAANEVLSKRGVTLPLENPKNAADNRIEKGRLKKGERIENDGRLKKDDRLEKGERAQIDIFGESMRGFAERGDEQTRHINKWLVDNCFGDYYTRGGLDYRQREMITFCFLAAQGGCEPQLVSHARANMRLGNDRAFLIKIISQCLPYVGYPRSLNALRCVEEAAKKS